LLPTLSATRRDTRTCSRPCESSSAISAMAGESRSRRIALSRSSSFVDSSGGRRESHLIWFSIWPMNWPIWIAALAACSRWVAARSCFCSR
jgi:hypothetical protein